MFLLKTLGRRFRHRLLSWLRGRPLARDGQSLHRIIDSLDTVIWEMDLLNREVMARSESVERILGFPATGRQDWLNRILAEDQPVFEENLRLALRGEVREIECRHLTPGGDIRWFQHRIQLKDSDFRHLIGLTVDITERKSRERHLLLSQFALEHASDAMSWVRSDGSIVYVNEAGCRLLGYSREEFTRLSVGDVDVNYRDDRWKQHWDVLRTRKHLLFETVHRSRDGRLIPVEVSAHYLSYEGRDYNCAMVRDITERKRTQERLRERERMLDLVLGSIREVFWMADVGLNRLHYASAAYEQIWQRPLKSLFGSPRRRLLATVHPADRGNVIRTLRAHSGAESGFEHEFRILRPDGSIRWIRDRGFPVRDADGQVDRIVGCAEDITDRKLAEQRAHESHRRFRQIAETIEDVFWMSDPEIDHGLYVSPAYERVWQRSLASFYENPRSFIDAIHPEDRGRVAAFLSIRNKRQAFEHEYRILRPDGSLRWILDRGFPLVGQDAGGEAIRFVGVARDITERKLAEARLHEREIEFRQIVETVREGIWAIDADARTTFVNPAMAAMLGEAPEDLLGRPLFDFMDETQQRLCQSLLARRRQGIAEAHDFEFRRKDGSVFWAMVNSSPTFDAAGRFRGALASMSDITLRKRSEFSMLEQNAELERRVAERTAELARSEERLRLALDASREGIWDYCFATGAAYWSPAFWRMLGYEPDEFESGLRSFLALVHPEDRQRVRDEVQTRMPATGQFQMEFRMRRKDGAHRWIFSRGEVVERDAAGQPLRAIGTHTDITERREAEERLRLSEERLRLAMEGARLGAWHWDVATDQVRWTPAALAIFALPAGAQPTLEDWKNCLHPDDRTAAVAALERCRRDGGDYMAEYRIVWSDGSIRWVTAMGRFFHDARESGPSMEGICFDMTERKRAELAVRELNASLEEKVVERTAQLAAANAAKSQFLAHMSHEIRTPMNAILGLAQILERYGLPPDQAELIHRISESGDSLLGIINDILDFSKIEAGQVRIEGRRFDLSALLRRLDSLLRPSAENKGLSLRLSDQTPQLGRLWGDALRLEQILLNLLGNAIKFTTRGEVHLCVRAVAIFEHQARLRFEVRDTGIGIADDALARLFQPFSQADGSITRRFGGTGLGLVICKRLTELMGGRLGAESKPGQGSLFWCELSFGRKVEAEDEVTGEDGVPANENTAVAGLAGLRVLAVDDNRLNLQVVERALIIEGAEVSLAADGRQALEILRDRPNEVDVVLMDVQMPVMDGLTATREIRLDPRLANIPVVALTAGVLPEERAAAQAAGVDGFIAKPVDLKHMRMVLSRYLATERSG